MSSFAPKSVQQAAAVDAWAVPAELRAPVEFTPTVLFLCSQSMRSADQLVLNKIGRVLDLGRYPDEVKDYTKFDFIILDAHSEEQRSLLRFVDLTQCKMVAYVRAFESSDESWLAGYGVQDILTIKKLPDLKGVVDKVQLLNALFVSKLKSPKSAVGFFSRKAVSWFLSLL
jgi:hypothetical protein